MNKFKVGDKVIVIDDDEGRDSEFYNIGDYGVIDEVNKDYCNVAFSFQKTRHYENKLWSVSYDQLELDVLAETPLRKALEENGKD